MNESLFREGQIGAWDLGVKPFLPYHCLLLEARGGRGKLGENREGGFSKTGSHTYTNWKQKQHTPPSPSHYSWITKNTEREHADKKMQYIASVLHKMQCICLFVPCILFLCLTMMLLSSVSRMVWKTKEEIGHIITLSPKYDKT